MASYLENIMQKITITVEIAEGDTCTDCEYLDGDFCELFLRHLQYKEEITGKPKDRYKRVKCTLCIKNVDAQKWEKRPCYT